MNHRAFSKKRQEVPPIVGGKHRAGVADSSGSRKIPFVLILRIILVCLSAEGGFYFPPGSASALWGAAAGIAFALLVVLLELRLQRSSLRRVVGGISGIIAGLVMACLAVLALSGTSLSPGSRSLICILILLFTVYMGIVVGTGKGNLLNLQSLDGIVGSEQENWEVFKVLDTSVLIDGRLADIADAQFLDGTLLVPRFILRELQAVADSSDGLKRQRGRRGLDVLQRIQKMPNLEVRIVEDEFPGFPEVDMKLMELARHYGAAIVTNDFNLNKVASLQGFAVLNVNQLAKALKPVVLPGEIMRVLIMREGKEHSQGVGYLDDGTMVVVEGARKFINRTIDITVTTLHQTTAGKMIFARYDDPGESVGRATSPLASEAPGSEAQNPSDQ